MFSLCLGIAAFSLYFLYDINSFLWKHPLPRCFFLMGTGFLGIAAVLDLTAAWQSGAFSGIGDLILIAGSAVCFAALIYCLFFALPFKETYADQTTGNHVYDGGVYALCRHPGILCFFALFLLLGIAALPGSMLRNGMVFSTLNLAYAWFQDRVTFPKTFCDYDAYRHNVPFLIPTKTSARNAWRTLFHADRQEDNP